MRSAPRQAAAALLAAIGMVCAWSSTAAQTLPSIKLSGDIRVRVEDDWDSHTATGARRPDRGRMRLRPRLGASADLGDGFVLEGRLRSGAEHSQQNANITFADFDGNPVDVFKIAAERYSLGWKRGAGAIQVGKVAFPFFTNNEYFWDADISPRGGDGSVAVPIGNNGRLRLIVGGFALPVGLARYSGHLFAGQVVAERGPATAAIGLFRFAADRSDPDRLLLLDGNGSRDYSILALNAAYKLTLGGKRVVVTADLFRDLQGYAGDLDPASRDYAHERTGFVVGAAAGDIAQPHHVQFGYRFFRMERLAVDSSYAHDDVARLGTASQALLTDLRGHDLYANLALTRHWTVGTRVMLTHRITSPEDDRRARLDLGYAF